MGMEKCFRLRNSVGEESMAGKTGMSQDWGAVSLVGSCNAGRGQRGRVVRSMAFLAEDGLMCYSTGSRASWTPEGSEQNVW